MPCTGPPPEDDGPPFYRDEGDETPIRPPLPEPPEFPPVPEPLGGAVETYESERFDPENGVHSHDEVVVHSEFTDTLETIEGYAEEQDLTVVVTGSFREEGHEIDEGDQVVPPADTSNHLAGHAIDVNLRTADGGFYNGEDLHPDNLSEASGEVRSFIENVREDDDLRWGGDFDNADPVHIDDHLNADESAWEERYEEAQQAFEEGEF